MCTRGDDAVRVATSRGFDVHASAVAYARSKPSMVLLGGATLSSAAAKCFGRLPTGALIAATHELPRNAGRHASVAVPERGPVTVSEIRERRAAARAARAAAAKPAQPSVEAGAASRERGEEEASDDAKEDEEEKRSREKAARKAARRAAREAEKAASTRDTADDEDQQEEEERAAERKATRKAARRAARAAEISEPVAEAAAVDDTVTRHDAKKAKRAKTD
jgi:hypothetical protein